MSQLSNYLTKLKGWHISDIFWSMCFVSIRHPLYFPAFRCRKINSQAVNLAAMTQGLSLFNFNVIIPSVLLENPGFVNVSKFFSKNVSAFLLIEVSQFSLCPDISLNPLPFSFPFIPHAWLKQARHQLVYGLLINDTKHFQKSQRLYNWRHWEAQQCLLFRPRVHQQGAVFAAFLIQPKLLSILCKSNFPRCCWWSTWPLSEVTPRSTMLWMHSLSGYQTFVLSQKS